MKADFEYVPPANLKTYWNTIKPGLETTMRKAPGGWIPEDVFHALMTGVSLLHIVRVGSYYRGFMVTQLIDSIEGKKLLIWIAHGDASGDVFGDNLDTIREWAKGLGAVKVQFQSGRKGWEKVGARIGFVPTMQIFECEV